jgi:hypothetical protein
MTSGARRGIAWWAAVGLAAAQGVLSPTFVAHGATAPATTADARATSLDAALAMRAKGRAGSAQRTIDSAYPWQTGTSLSKRNPAGTPKTSQERFGESEPSDEPKPESWASVMPQPSPSPSAMPGPSPSSPPKPTASSGPTRSPTEWKPAANRAGKRAKPKRVIDLANPDPGRRAVVPREMAVVPEAKSPTAFMLPDRAPAAGSQPRTLSAAGDAGGPGERAEDVRDVANADTTRRSVYLPDPALGSRLVIASLFALMFSIVGLITVAIRRRRW